MKLCLLIVFMGLGLGSWSAHAQTQTPDVLRFAYAPSPDIAIEKMFAMAKVTKNDVVFDLGCGDGRIVMQAAARFGSHAVGIDLNPERIHEALERVKKQKLEHLVDTGLLELRYGNALTAPDLEQASVIFLYMTPQFMNEFKKVAQKRLKPGTRIVAYNYSWTGDRSWKPDKIAQVEYQGIPSEVFLWIVKDQKF